jgi:hypothetical protein
VVAASPIGLRERGHRCAPTVRGRTRQRGSVIAVVRRGSRRPVHAPRSRRAPCSPPGGPRSPIPCGPPAVGRTPPRCPAGRRRHLGWDARIGWSSRSPGRGRVGVGRRSATTAAGPHLGPPDRRRPWSGGRRLVCHGRRCGSPSDLWRWSCRPVRMATASVAPPPNDRCPSAGPRSAVSLSELPPSALPSSPLARASPRERLVSGAENQRGCALPWPKCIGRGAPRSEHHRPPSPPSASVAGLRRQPGGHLCRQVRAHVSRVSSPTLGPDRAPSPPGAQQPRSPSCDHRLSCDLRLCHHHQ